MEPASLAAMSPRRRSRSFRPSAGQLQLGDAIRAFRGGSDGTAGVYGAMMPGGHECCCCLGTGWHYLAQTNSAWQLCQQYKGNHESEDGHLKQITLHCRHVVS